MRRFQLQRDEDASGVSGTGVVAEGVQFTDGSCAMRWLTATSSTAIYASERDIESIHGHGGRTRLIWLDAAPAIRLESQPGEEHLRTIGRRLEIIARLHGCAP